MCPYTSTIMSLCLSKLGDNNKTYVSDCMYGHTNQAYEEFI